MKKNSISTNFRYTVMMQNLIIFILKYFIIRILLLTQQKRRKSFFKQSNKVRYNLYDFISLYFLSKFYLNGYGTSHNLLKAEIIFQRLHFKKKDIGTLCLIKCMIKQKKIIERSLQYLQ
jgi:hypothetical protein